MIHPTPYLINRFAEHYYRQRQIAFMSGLVIWILFSLWDVKLFRDSLIFNELIFIRLQVGAPIIAILGLMTFFQKCRKDTAMSFLGGAAIATSWCCLVAMMAINSPVHTMDLYVPGMLTVLVFHFTMFRQRWKFATIVGIILLGIFNFAGNFALQDVLAKHLSVGWFSANVYMVSFVVIGAMVSYQVEATFYLTETQRLELEFKNLAIEASKKEEQVAKNQAEIAYQERTQFLLQTSHDLRQPMQAIKYFVSSLKDGVNEPQALEVVHKLQRAVKSMDDLYNGLHDFNRIDANVITADKVVFFLPMIVEEEINNCMPIAVEKGLGLHAHISHAAWVETDLSLVRRMIRNLLSNALTYTHHGGVIVSLRKRADSAYFQVFDTGEGIEEKDLSDIFRPFVRLRPDGSRSRRGLGLGLAIAAGMAEKIGTRIEVRSQLGKGSMFGFRLPGITKTMALSTPAKSAMATRIGRSLGRLVRCVALVDDDPEILEGCKTLLTSAGYSVVEGRNGAELLARVLAHHERPSILLADIELEAGEDAWQVHEALQQQLMASLPVVLITGAVTGGYRERAAQQEQMILQKPCDPEVILDALDTAFKNHYNVA